LKTAIPSVPLSSTPVKQIDAIAKYPTNDDFNAFEDKLQGNPESLVKLRGNQAEQRRKFQNDWQDRNPNAAKFLGAWYTGNRYFYVFPSTAKSRTCVVTQDANGNLDMQIGTVLNQELRYGGGKGFFWRDRSNIIASRDSGSGSLYPIYATSAIPELPESIIGDMERQKCITALPFEADAQYYKERGNKFAKLGKKDEAVANYRRAIELYRKQNQLAQIRSLESLIAGLSGTSANKPTTPKPLDTAYSLPSPLYEDVNDPNYGSEAFKNRKDITPTFRVGLNAFDVVDNGQTVRLNSKVNSSAPTIIITHGWKNDLTSAEFRNLLKAIRYNSSMQVLVTDWSQASKTDITELGLAASRIEVSASKVVDLIQKYKLNPNNVHLIGHSLGAHLSVEIALELQKRSLGGVKSITLLDPAVDLPTGYQVKALSDVSPTTFIRAFYASLGGDSKFAASANESYNIKFPFGPRRPDYSHGEAMTLLANSFQGNSNGDRNCIAERFIKLDERFPNMPQNDTRQLGDGNSLTDLLVGYDKNNWLYPKKIIRGKDYVEPEKGKCILDSNLYAQ
jgi:pimeloyl-ACP methyl ester carboxylesterase